MLLHGGRPDQRILFCPAPGPPFAHQSIRAALMASKDMTDFMQGRCIGDRGPDRRDPNLMKFLAVDTDDRHDQGGTGAARRADGAEQIDPGEPPVAPDARTRAALGPDAGQRALLANAGFILKPDFDRPADKL
jgi:hypothetical protein